MNIKLQATTIFRTTAVLILGLLLVAPVGSSYGGDGPSIYSQMIAKAGSGEEKPGNWRELVNSGQAQAVAFFMVDTSGNLAKGPRIVSQGHPDALRKALEISLRNSIIKAAPFKGAPNRRYAGQVLKIRIGTCKFAEDSECDASISNLLPADVRAWKNQ